MRNTIFVYMEFQKCLKLCQYVNILAVIWMERASPVLLMSTVARLDPDYTNVALYQSMYLINEIIRL